MADRPAVLERFHLHGKRALVTGGSRGLGREMALALADVGADLVLVARDRDGLERTAAAARACGGEVFQSYALYPHMTVFGNMAFGLKLQKTAKGEIDRRVREAAELLSISELLERKPRELSGGQRQRAGLVEQVGTPHEIYNHPASHFVAGFIGAPKMNFIPGELVETDGGGLALRLGNFASLSVPPERHAAYPDHLGRPVELGIRPEWLTVGDGGGAIHPARMEVDVEVIEPTGGETLVFTRVNDAEVSAKCDPNLSVTPGTRVTLTADMSHMHLIEMETDQVVPVAATGR